MHGDVRAAVIIGGVSGDTASNLGLDTASPEQVFSFLLLVPPGKLRQ